jgi:hypothetical protein
MKVILVARKALAAYLVSSAVRRPVKSSGGVVEIERAVDLFHDLAARSSSVPMTMRSGRLKSAIAAPSRRNSGIGDDGDLRIGPCLADDPLDLVAGADRHGRLGNKHREAIDGFRDLPRRVE